VQADLKTPAAATGGAATAAADVRAGGAVGTAAFPQTPHSDASTRPDVSAEEVLATRCGDVLLRHTILKVGTRTRQAGTQQQQGQPGAGCVLPWAVACCCSGGPSINGCNGFCGCCRRHRRTPTAPLLALFTRLPPAACSHSLCLPCSPITSPAAKI
jgi:hypothetical protein